MAVEADTIL